MIIKKMQIEDYKKFNEEIAKFIGDIYSNNFNISIEESKRIGYEKTENLEKFLYDGSAILIGCIDETRLIAFAWLYIYEYFGEKRIHVNQVSVDSIFRGKGIGRQLMLEIEKEANRLEADVIDLFVMESNKTAQHLYSNLDFKTEKRYMSKKLKVNK